MIIQELALFELDDRAGIAELLPCGHRTDAHGEGEQHETECLGGVCPFCLDPAGGYYVWLHHNPRGYRDSGICAVQRHMFEVIAECIRCRSYTFGTEGCRNGLCPNSELGRSHDD